MGSFNVTCFASNQVIAEKAHCYVFPIRQASSFDAVEGTFQGNPFKLHSFANTNTSPDCFWEPIGSPIKARYNDYGRFKVLDTPENHQALLVFIDEMASNSTISEALREFMKKDARGALAYFFNPSPNTPVAEPNFVELSACWDFVQEVISEYQVFSANLYPRVLRPVAVAAMHAEAFEALGRLTEQTPTRHGESMGMGDLLQRTKEGILESTRLKQLYVQEEPEGVVRFFIEHAFWERLKYVGSDQGLQLPGEEVFQDALRKAGPLEKLSRKRLKDILEPMLRPRYVYAALNRLEIRFSPVVFGGQDYDNEFGQEYARFVSEVSQKVCRARAEDVYGPYQKYSVLLGKPDAFNPTELARFARECDAAVNVLELVKGEAKGADRLHFEWTANLSDTRDMLTQFSADYPAAELRVDSLQKG